MFPVPRRPEICSTFEPRRVSRPCLAFELLQSLACLTLMRAEDAGALGFRV